MRSRLKLVSFCVTMLHKPLSVGNHKLWSILHHWKCHSESNIDHHNSTISSTVNKATTEMVQMVNLCGSPQSMIPWVQWIAQGCRGQRRLLGDSKNTTQRCLSRHAKDVNCNTNNCSSLHCCDCDCKQWWHTLDRDIGHRRSSGNF